MNERSILDGVVIKVFSTGAVDTFVLFPPPPDSSPDKSVSEWQFNRQPRRDGHCPSAKYESI